MPISSDCHPGRFEAEFVEAGEIGSGEFGKVMRVRLKSASASCTADEENEWAVKRSKRFEGARHRYVQFHCSPFRYFSRPDLGVGLDVMFLGGV